MKASASNTPLSPEEFQRQLTDFVRQHFQNPKGASGDAAPSEEVSGAGGESREDKDEDFEFKHTPRDVKEYLDRFVIKQHEAKKVLSVALCDHYHHVRLALEGKE